MTDRRKFLIQGALTAGSFLLAKPFKALSASPLYSGTGRKISIADIGNLSQSWNNVLGNYDNYNQLRNLPSHVRYKGGNALLLATGNNFTSSFFLQEDHISQVAALKAIGFDAIVPGKTELANGEAYYSRLMQQHNLPVLCSHSPFDAQGLLPHHIVQKGDLTIGIIGNNNRFNPYLDKDENLQQIAHSVSYTAADLKANHNCHMVVCMQYDKEHKDFSDARLSSLTSDIDVMISPDNYHNSKVYCGKNKNRQEVFVSFSRVAKRIEIEYNSSMQKVNLAVFPLS